MRITFLAASACVILALAAGVPAQEVVTHETGIKYMRDSEEYAVLARQVYRLAGQAVMRSAKETQTRNWAVVMDVDETSLDNSTYQLERAAYGLPFEAASWNAWVERREAPAVPGVSEFIKTVRQAGGHVGWITNRELSVADATRANLVAAGLWTDEDRLCTQKTAQDTKADRRRELVTGNGTCAWAATPMRAVAFVGDQLGDFPAPGEQIPGTGTDDAFGRTCFLLPNSMYGSWTTRVTRASLRPAH